MAPKPQSLDHIFEVIETAQTLDALWEAHLEFLISYGADLISYHHIPPYFAQDSKAMDIRAYGFPEDWVESYAAGNLNAVDPITSRAQFSLKPFRWSSLQGVTGLTPDQRKYMARLSEEVGGDGLAIPAFGPSGRNGYFGIGRKDGNIAQDAKTHRRIYWACQAFHDQYCLIKVQSQAQDFQLTPREMEIMNKLGQGLSETTIAAMLHVTANRITQQLGQIMSKMGVSDKNTALLRAYSCGLIDAPEDLAS